MVSGLLERNEHCNMKIKKYEEYIKKYEEYIRAKKSSKAKKGSELISVPSSPSSSSTPLLSVAANVTDASPSSVCKLSKSPLIGNLHNAKTCTMKSTTGETGSGGTRHISTARAKHSNTMTLQAQQQSTRNHLGSR